jgi:hypothetical protein
MQERRRFPRRTVQNESVTLPASLPVQVLDISVSGVLLRAERPVPHGASGSLRINLDGVPLTANVRVQRVTESAGAAGAYGIGAMFLSLTPRQQQLIDRFMLQ